MVLFSQGYVLKRNHQSLVDCNAAIMICCNTPSSSLQTRISRPGRGERVCTHSFSIPKALIAVEQGMNFVRHENEGSQMLQHLSQSEPFCHVAKENKREHTALPP